MNSPQIARPTPSSWGLWLSRCFCTLEAQPTGMRSRKETAKAHKGPEVSHAPRFCGADCGAELLRGGDLPERGEGARRGLAHGEALVQERVRQRPERQVRLRERGRESSR